MSDGLASETSRILTSAAQHFVLDLVLSKPGLYLREIQKELKDFLMVDVSLSTICKFLHKSCFTRQRLHLVAMQQDQFLREKFIIDMSLYSPNMLVFIDETGADRRNTLRKYSYSLRGKPATQEVLLVRGERVSATRAHHTCYAAAHACAWHACGGIRMRCACAVRLALWGVVQETVLLKGEKFHIWRC